MSVLAIDYLVVYSVKTDLIAYTLNIYGKKNNFYLKPWILHIRATCL